MFAIALTYWAITPVAPAIAADLHLGPGQFGLAVGAALLVAGLLQIPLGVAADRFGRARFLCLGAATLVASVLLCAHSRWVPEFVASQLLLGASSPMVAASATAIVSEAFSVERRTRALGLLQAAVNLGQLTGLVAAGTLAALFGWRTAILALVAVPALLLWPAFRVPEPPRRAPTRSPAGEVLLALKFIVAPSQAPLTAVAALSMSTGIGALYLLPFVARAQGLGPQATGLLLVPFMIGAVLGAPSVGALADRIGFLPPLVGSLLVAAGSLAAFALAGSVLPAGAVCFGLAGAGTSAASTLVLSSFAGRLGRRRSAGMGAGLGGIRLAQQGLASLAPALAGFVFAARGPAPAFGALAGGLLVAVALALAGTLRPSRTGT
jgi:MFS family permease